MIHSWGITLAKEKLSDSYIFFDLCLFKHFSPVANFGHQSLNVCENTSMCTKILLQNRLNPVVYYLSHTQKSRVRSFMKKSQGH